VVVFFCVPPTHSPTSAPPRKASVHSAKFCQLSPCLYILVYACFLPAVRLWLTSVRLNIIGRHFSTHALIFHISCNVGYSPRMRSALNPLPFFFSIINTIILNDIENKIVRRIAFAAAICNYIWLVFGVPLIGVMETKKIPERPEGIFFCFFFFKNDCI
jgi:predicted neutral ceramidase superfamily lipid hydrolase